MPHEKSKYRLIENVGEIWMEKDGTYSYRCFEFDITESGIETVYRAECKMEGRWATECKRRAGQLEGYEMHADPKERKYYRQAFELLRRKW